MDSDNKNESTPPNPQTPPTPPTTPTKPNLNKVQTRTIEVGVPRAIALRRVSNVVILNDMYKMERFEVPPNAKVTLTLTITPITSA